METLSSRQSSCEYPLGAICLAGVSVSGGVAMVLTKKHQKKLMKVTKLVDITLALSVFETSVFKALNDGKIDKREFAMLQALHLEALNGLSNVGSKMTAKTTL